MLILAQIGFVVVTVVYVGLFFREIKKGIALTGWDIARKKKLLNSAVIACLLWAIFVSGWSLSGMMADFTRFPFNFAPILIIPLLSIIILLFSKTLGEILRHIPPANLIRLQSFRVFVEILLWVLFVENLLPVQMTFEGRNFDVLSGLTAPLIAWLAARNKISNTGILIWNVLCLCLLINIVGIAILSTPSPIRVFMNEPANTIVAYFPISWLPGFLVPLAYTLNLFSLRQTLSKAKT